MAAEHDDSKDSGGGDADPSKDYAATAAGDIELTAPVVVSCGGVRGARRCAVPMLTGCFVVQAGG